MGGDSNLKGIAVLVVDDHAGGRRLVADVLRAGGVGRVVAAESGAEGLSRLVDVKPDLLITDRRMPGIDGVKVVRTVRQAAVNGDPRIPNPRLPIIMLSGDRSQKDVEEARSAGADAFLMKPFTPAKVLERVSTVLGRPTDFVISSAYVGPDRRRESLASYRGLLRRRGDAPDPVDAAARDILCMQVIEELEIFRGLVEARGRLDLLLRQMAMRVVHDIRYRARSVGERAMERACMSLDRYVSGVGGARNADPEVIETHLDTLGALARLPAGQGRSSDLIVRQLDRAVARRLANAALVLAA